MLATNLTSVSFQLAPRERRTIKGSILTSRLDSTTSGRGERITNLRHFKHQLLVCSYEIPLHTDKSGNDAQVPHQKNNKNKCGKSKNFDLFLKKSSV